MTNVRLIVHRSTQSIGGNCIEIGIESGSRILLDVGRPLDAPDDAQDLLPATLNLQEPSDGVLISHAHQDHYGLLEQVPATWPVYSGRATERLIRLTSGLFGGQVSQNFVAWESGVPFEVGPFRVTPFLTDHSAFDAYMLLIEVAGKRIFYSGDFRTHGRKGALTERIMRRPPADLDVLLMEGTNLGSDKSCVRESGLERDFIDLFKTTAGRVFVAWSAQNIDRTVTLYRACLQADRILVVDLYTAEVLELLGEFGRLPRAGWNGIKVVITSRLASRYRMTGRGDFVARMAQHGISAKALAATPTKWVAMVRPSLVPDYVRKGVAPCHDDAWCWSMWRGYLKDESGRRLQAWFDRAGSRPAHLHTSGHASPEVLRDFARALNPKRVVPIHGIAWGAEAAGFEGLTPLVDGQVLTL